MKVNEIITFITPKVTIHAFMSLFDPNIVVPIVEKLPLTNEFIVKSSHLNVATNTKAVIIEDLKHGITILIYVLNFDHPRSILAKIKDALNFDILG